MIAEPITERRLELKIDGGPATNLASGATRPRHRPGIVVFEFDGTTATARHRSTGGLLFEGEVAEFKSLPKESWRLAMVSGEVWSVGGGCGCGSKS